MFRGLDYLFSSIGRRVMTENIRVTTVAFAVLKNWVNLQKVSGSGENLFCVNIKKLKLSIEKNPKIKIIKISWGLAWALCAVQTWNMTPWKAAAQMWFTVLDQFLSLNFKLRIIIREDNFWKEQLTEIDFCQREMFMNCTIKFLRNRLGWNNVSLFMNVPLFLIIFTR